MLCSIRFINFQTFLGVQIGWNCSARGYSVLKLQGGGRGRVPPSRVNLPHRDLAFLNRDLGIPPRDLSAGWPDEKEPASKNKSCKFRPSIVPNCGKDLLFFGLHLISRENTSIFGEDICIFFWSSPNSGKNNSSLPVFIQFGDGIT